MTYTWDAYLGRAGEAMDTMPEDDRRRCASDLEALVAADSDPGVRALERRLRRVMTSAIRRLLAGEKRVRVRVEDLDVEPPAPALGFR